MQHLQCAAIGLDPRTNLGDFAKRMVTKNFVASFGLAE